MACLCWVVYWLRGNAMWLKAWFLYLLSDVTLEKANLLSLSFPIYKMRVMIARSLYSAKNACKGLA